MLKKFNTESVLCDFVITDTICELLGLKHSLKLTCRPGFYREMRCTRGLCCHAVSVRPSVRLSRSWITSKRINISSKFFSPSGSDTILVFPYQRGCRYSDGNPPNGDVECKGGMIKWRFFHKYLAVSQKRLYLHGHMKRDNLLTSNSHSIHTTFSVIASGASPGETIMW